jgi:adenylate cyclase
MMKFKGQTSLKANILFNTFIIICFFGVAIASYNYFSVKNIVIDTAFNLIKRQNQAVVLRAMDYMEEADEEARILSIAIGDEKNLHDPSVLSKITNLMGQFKRVSNFVIPVDKNNYVFVSQISHYKMGSDLYLGVPIDSNAAFILGFVQIDQDQNVISRKMYYYSDKYTLIKELNVDDNVLKEVLSKISLLITNNASKDKKSLIYSKITNNPVITLVCPQDSTSGRSEKIYAEVTFNDLALYLDINRINENSSLFLVDNHQNLVAYSSLPQKFKHVGILDLNNPNVKLFKVGFDKSSKQSSASRQDKGIIFSYNDTDYMIENTTFPSVSKLDWKVVSICALSDFTKIAEILMQKGSLVFSLVILLIALFWLYFQINKYSQPIVNLALEAHKIHAFDLDDSVNIESSTKEISNLAVEIQNMKTNVKNFARFIPKELVQKFIRSGEDVEIGGKEVNITVLFTDIANFTTLSEAREPTKLVTQLSEYLEELSSVILKNKGTIDKYIGDAIMSFWGAPDLDSDQTENACISALICMEKLIGLNKYWINSDQCEFRTRIGIHEGRAIVGNIGSSERMNYTAIGDNVNLAARLEGANKQYGTNILISEPVHQKLSSNFIRRPVDIVAFKGKAEGIKIYQLIGIDDHAYLRPISEKYRDYLAQYNEAYEAYVQRDWKKAKKLFSNLREAALKMSIEDKLIEIYSARVEEFIKNPPEKNWNGIIHLKEK